MKTAMIFAAGRGERLKPLTDTCPKALCKVHNQPLIEYHVQRLAKAGFDTIVINIAHLGSMIRDYLGNGSRWHIKILYSPEPPGALETGGGLVNARPLLGDAPFVTVNADILSDYDFAQLSLPEDRLAHLVLVDRPDYYLHSDFGLSEHGLLSLHNKRYTFSGIACYSPRLLEHLQPGRFSITPILKQLTATHQVSAEVYQGNWMDIGSPERLASVHR